MQQIGLVFIAIIMSILALIGVIILGIRELVVRIKLGRSGVKVDGHITDHRKEGGYRNRKYYLTYDYDYNGSTYSRKERVSFFRYYMSDEFDGFKVSVSCLPEDPKTARLGYKIPDSMVGPVALILIGIAVVIIALAIATGFAIEWFVIVRWW